MDSHSQDLQLIIARVEGGEGAAASLLFHLVVFKTGNSTVHPVSNSNSPGRHREKEREKCERFNSQIWNLTPQVKRLREEKITKWKSHLVILQHWSPTRGWCFSTGGLCSRSSRGGTEGGKDHGAAPAWVRKQKLWSDNSNTTVICARQITGGAFIVTKTSRMAKSCIKTCR